MRVNPVSLIGIVVASALTGAGCSRSAHDFVEIGNKFSDARKHADALIQYQKAIQKDPNFGEAYYRIGLLEIAQNHGIEGYTPLLRAVQLMPDNDEAKIRLADLSLALLVVNPRHPKPLYEQTEKLADQILEKNGRSFDGLRVKASLRLLDRKPQEAIPLFEKANQAEPMRPDLVEGWVQALFLDNQIDEGERLALKIIAKEKTFRTMYDVLYRQYMGSNRPADAENILRLKVANNPTDASSFIQLARHYAFTKNTGAMNSILQRMLNDSKDFPDGRLDVGNFYSDLSQLDQAAEQFYEGIRSAAPSKKAVYQKRIVDTLLAQGKTGEARNMVDLILKANPKDDEARRIHAILVLDAGGSENAAAALTELKALAADRANDPRLISLMGQAQLALGHPDEAWNEFQRVVALRKDDLPSRFFLATISLNQKKPDAAQRYADEILALDAGNASAKFLRINALIAEGLYSRARTELTIMLRQYPDSPDLQIELGTLDVAEKKYEAAETVFLKLRSSGSADPRPLVGIVESLSARSQWDKAIELLNADLKKSPDSSAVRKLLASTAVLAGKYDVAMSQYQFLAAKAPQSVDYLTRLAELHRLKGDLNGAMAELDRATRLAPNDPDPVMQQGSILQSAGRSAEAQAAYRRVLALRPNNPFAMNNLAFLLADTGGDLNEAQRLAQRALAAVPGHPFITDTMGWIYLKKGDRASAAQIFSSLVRQQPGDPTFRYHYALTLFGQGDKQQAQEQVAAALKGRPDPAIEGRLKDLESKIR